VYATYEHDHRGLDAIFADLNTAVSVRDPLETARATKAFKFHLDLHLAKEDAHMYRMIEERVSLADQYKAISSMGNSHPHDRFPDVVAWMFPLMNNDDRASILLFWKTTMPAPVFAHALPLIQRAVGDDWAALARRIPSDAQESYDSAARSALTSLLGGGAVK
jgi:hypothetical protein